MSELTLEQKQRRSLAIILEFAMGSTAASSIPTPVFEVPKQLMLTVADLTLCWRLYALYYDEELSKDSLLALINRAGIAPVAGGAIAYAGARTVQGIADETLNLSIVGTLLSGIIAGSSTALVGLAFLAWVNNAWQQDQAQLQPVLIENASSQRSQ
jgi:hypothetical protein